MTRRHRSFDTPAPPAPAADAVAAPRRTKIVATLGPASDSPAGIEALIRAGVDVFRFNFSHGNQEDHGVRIARVREIARRVGRNVAILQDVQGPKIRIGDVKDGVLYLEEGEVFRLTDEPVLAADGRASVSYPNLAKEVPVGATIMMDDGLLELRVEAIEAGDLVCRVVIGGPLKPKKGVNFPGIMLSISALTAKDKEDIAFGVAHGVDWIAVSFVQRPSDVAEAKEWIKRCGGDALVCAKIEKREAVNALDGILELADGAMVARGDLGVELHAEEVPLIQKRVIKKCNLANKPVITATQMLDSMIHFPRPTRAEASDVANAILDGTDAIMLSNETATGKYAVEAVRTMDRIAREVERALHERPPEVGRAHGVSSAISSATCQIAQSLRARAIITATHSGSTTRQVAKYRPSRLILAATPIEATARRLALVWGVIPLLIESVEDTDALFEIAIRSAVEAGYLRENDVVVITAGVPMGRSGSTNLIKVETVRAAGASPA